MQLFGLYIAKLVCLWIPLKIPNQPVRIHWSGRYRVGAVRNGENLIPGKEVAQCLSVVAVHHTNPIIVPAGDIAVDSEFDVLTPITTQSGRAEDGQPHDADIPQRKQQQ